MAVLPPRFRCPRCGWTTYSLVDVREGYCGRCHAWTGRGQGGSGYRMMWLIGSVAEGYMTAAEIDPWMDMPEPGVARIMLRGVRYTGPGLEAALRTSGVPELAALADLISAHRDEFEAAVVAEGVLRALGG